MYTAKLDALLLIKFVWSIFQKNGTCSIASNKFDEKEPIRIKIPTCEEEITKIKLQMNEHEISIHINSNSRIQIVQPEFTTWKYKVKLSAEAANRGVL